MNKKRQVESADYVELMNENNNVSNFVIRF